MSCPSVTNSKKFIILNRFDWRGQAQLSEANRKTNVTPAFILIQLREIAFCLQSFWFSDISEISRESHGGHLLQFIADEP